MKLKVRFMLFSGRCPTVVCLLTFEMKVAVTLLALNTWPLHACIYIITSYVLYACADPTVPYVVDFEWM